MSKLSLVWRVGVYWALIGTLPVLSMGQSGYSANGGEYSIAGAARGDQVRPALSINPSGGYLVWQGNGVDGMGMGIGAVALNDALSATQSPFRVNQRIGGDQERPQVSVLPGGGAAFVWQSGLQGYQHIYARFLSSSNAWQGPDVRVSGRTDVYQGNPVISTLTNGNVVVVWNSRNQFSASSMQDVYGQVLSPTGQKLLSSEFLVNQFTSYNQRTPAVAALPSGGFIVVWVSEQERVVPVLVSNQLDTFSLGGALGQAAAMSHPSVDIYGREFNADGSVASDEFLINTSYDICANPRVAVGGDGSFMVTWSQFNRAVPTNGWDIFVRPFTNANPTSGGVAQLVNTTVYGDQYVPQISAIGTQYLVVWSSLGQEGATEGVYGQFLGNDGSRLGGEFRVNTALSTAMNLRMHPAVASDSNNQFVAVWSAFIPGVKHVGLVAQRFTGSNAVPPTVAGLYTAPGSDPFQADPTVDGTPALPRTPFGPSLTGGPAPYYPGPLYPVSSNGFTAVKGAYSGLFYDTNGITPLSAGSFTANTTDGGTYSATFILGERTYRVSGRFDGSGAATKTIKRGAGIAAMNVQLQASGDQILGTIQAGSWTADIIANRQAALTKSTGAAAQPGSYTLVIPPDTNSPGPAGFGFGTLKVDSLGNVRWAGTLADGTKVTQKSSISKDGVWPLYNSVYSGGGPLIGWQQFGTNQPDSDLGGEVIWMKPKGVGGRNYFGGFTNFVWSGGSIYAPPVRGSKALNLSGGTGTLVFNGGGVSVTNTITMDGRNHVTSQGGPRLTFTLTPSTGLFRGTVNPTGGKAIPFQGALFQDTTNGFGFFLNQNHSGWIYLSPTP